MARGQYAQRLPWWEARRVMAEDLARGKEHRNQFGAVHVVPQTVQRICCSNRPQESHWRGGTALSVCTIGVPGSVRPGCHGVISVQ